ncbi:MAG: hypothetical protein VXX20_02110, partial [Verrucomicrobiota bacterium]|nr:hypothetical protein [Verrucomicrobiota bacterium]
KETKLVRVPFLKIASTHFTFTQYAVHLLDLNRKVIEEFSRQLEVSWWRTKYGERTSPQMEIIVIGA